MVDVCIERRLYSGDSWMAGMVGDWMGMDGYVGGSVYSSHECRGSLTKKKKRITGEIFARIAENFSQRMNLWHRFNEN